MYARPQILWGTNFENILELGYFDNRVTQRRPWKNAERTMRGGGVEDAWMTGFDYELHGDVRWIPDYDITNPYICSGWAGGVGFQAFFDWARASNTFRYVPDRNFPGVFVDNCYLADPWEDNGGSLENNGTRRVSIVIRNQLVDFSVVERGLILDFGVGQVYTDPATASMFTFSRNTALATQVENDGSVAEYQANVIRDRHHQAGFALGSKAIMLESVRQNKVENGDFEQDIVGANSNAGATLTRDSTQKKHKSWSLKVDYPNTSGSGPFFRTRSGSQIPAVAGRIYTYSMWVYAPTASVGKAIRMNIEWADSVPTVISVSFVSKTMVAGWQWLTFTATAPANTAFVTLSFYADGAQGTFTVWIDLLQFEEGAYATEPIPTNTATATRNEDRLKLVLPVKLPMNIDWTIFVHLQARSTNVASWDDTQPQLDTPVFGFFKAGSTTNNGESVRLHRQNGATQYEWEWGTNLNGANRTFTTGTAPIKIVCRHRASDHVLSCAIDNSAFASGTTPPNTSFFDLSDLLFYDTTFAGIGANMGLIRVKIAAGLKTQAEMEAM